MNLFAAAEYALKHKDDFTRISAMLPKEQENPQLTADLIALVNKHWPEFNPNSLIEDTLALIRVETQ